MQREALIVLVGITAGRRARRHVAHFYASQGSYDVYVPNLPYRRQGLRQCARWFSRYLETQVVPRRYQALHGIAYIAGGLLLRCLPQGQAPLFERLVCFRGPIQERVPAAMVWRFGRPLSLLLGGRCLLDLADGWPDALPQVRHGVHEGLVIERGRSRLASRLGIRAAAVAPAEWTPEHLLPAAEDVQRIRESHDEVYTSHRVLAAALHFIRHGAFADAAAQE